MKTKYIICLVFCALTFGCGASLDFPERLNPTPAESEGQMSQNSSTSSATSQNSSSNSGSISNDSSSTSADSESSEETELKQLNYLIINEVYYDAPDVDTNGDVFIELLGEPEVDAGGVKILLVNGDDGKTYQTIELPLNSFPSPEGLFVVADAITGNDSQSHVSGADYILNFDPQNGADAVIVVSKDGILLDSVCYGKPKTLVSENGFQLCEGEAALDVSGGKSITRLLGADSGNNAVDFIENAAPSPDFL